MIIPIDELFCSICAFKAPKNQFDRNWFEPTPSRYSTGLLKEPFRNRLKENQEKPLHEGCLGGAERSSAVTLRRCEPGQPRVLPK
jgi:hypothetical protein